MALWAIIRGNTEILKIVVCVLPEEPLVGSLARRGFVAFLMSRVLEGMKVS
jgi:hypothetical protein